MRSSCRDRAGDGAHLFLCPRCRVERRLAAALSRFPRPSRSEIPQRPRAGFVEHVVSAVTSDRRRRMRRRVAMSVAAGLIFFFLAGAAGETRSLETARGDEAYTSLLAPPALEGLLPE